MILDIQGGNKQLQQAIINALRIATRSSRWPSGTRRPKLNVTGQGTEEVAMVASDVKADAVVTGKVQAGQGQRRLEAEHRRSSGLKRQTDRQDQHRPQVAEGRPDAVAQVEKRSGQRVEKAIAGEAAEPAQPTEPKEPSSPTPSQLGVEEDPIAKMKKLEEQQRKGAVRRAPGLVSVRRCQRWLHPQRPQLRLQRRGQPLVPRLLRLPDQAPRSQQPRPEPPPVYTYGAKLSKCPKYDTSVAGGVRVDVTGYPLAFMNIDPIRGLGIGVTFDYMFWPPSTTTGTNPVTLDTREFRFEVGLRYHWNILNKRSRPSILANVQFGGHYFAVAKQEKSYTFMDENFMTQTAKGHRRPRPAGHLLPVPDDWRRRPRAHFANDKMFFGLLVNFNFHVVLGFGEIGTRFADESTAAALYGNGGYGPASGFGLRASFTPLEAMVWKGLTVRLSGFYELFKYSFALGDALASPARTAARPAIASPTRGPSHRPWRQRQLLWRHRAGRLPVLARLAPLSSPTAAPRGTPPL